MLAAVGADNIDLPDRVQLARYLETVVKMTDNEIIELFQVCAARMYVLTVSEGVCVCVRACVCV